MMQSMYDVKAIPDTAALLDRYFEVVPATSLELLDRIYSLRFKVYCIEHHFEDPAQYPNGRERDRYDATARHVALLHRASGEVVGTGRLILPSGPPGSALPILSLVGGDTLAELQKYPLEQLGEISRYVVSKTFRRRKGEDEFPDVGFSPEQPWDMRRVMPHLTMGLIRGLLELGGTQTVRYFCACMRPALLRLLKQLGFEFKPIGPLVEHHGLRQPCIGVVADLIAGLSSFDQTTRTDRSLVSGATSQFTKLLPFVKDHS